MTRRRFRAVTAAAVLAVSVGLAGTGPAGAAGSDVENYPAPANGVFPLAGSGWGHGRGMSQWGAYQAASEGVSYREILDFYYPGTSLSTTEAGAVRVLLTSDTGRDLIVRAVPDLTATSGDEPVALVAPTGCTTAVTRWRARATNAGLRVDGYCKGWQRGTRLSSTDVSFASDSGLVATKNGAVRRAYRGSVGATRTGSRSVQVINTVAMEQYLRAVVSSEVSPSWPVQALRAQAVAARSYATYEKTANSKRAFDVYDGVQSQAYPGAASLGTDWGVLSSREYDRTDAAIEATAAVVVVSQSGKPALTQFGASNGGVTASGPLAYQVAATDEWDTRAVANPRRAWTDSITVAALAARYPSAGQIEALQVLEREGGGAYGGRVLSMRVVGSVRSYTITGDSAIRSALGVYSSVFAITSPQG